MTDSPSASSPSATPNAAPTGFRVCPHGACRTPLVPGSSHCPRCGIPLTGPEASRLADVDAQIATLWTEASRLTARLLAQRVTPDAAGLGGLLPPSGPFAAPPAPPAPRRSLSGQQLLLGLGALLVLSAASFFLLVVWVLVGPVGQLALVALLAGTALTGTALAARSGLGATAETGGVIAAGLVTLVAGAARGFDVAGLDRVDASGYGAVAALLVAAVLLAADAVMPRGTRAYRVVVLRPLAAAAVAGATWFAAGWLTPGSAAVGVVAAHLAVGLAGLALAGLAERYDVTPDHRGWSHSPSALVLAASGLLGLAVHLLAGLVVGLDVTRPVATRMVAAGVLGVLPLLVAAVGVVVSYRGGSTDVPRWAAVASVALLVAPALVVLLPATAWAVTAAAVALAALLVLDATSLAPGARGRTWRGPVRVAAHGWLPVLVGAVALLELGGRETLDRLLGDGATFAAGPGPTVVVVTALAWAVPCALEALRRFLLASPPYAAAGAWAVPTELGLGLAVGRLLMVVDQPLAWAVTGLVTAALGLASAAWLARHSDRYGVGLRPGLELVLVGFAVLHGVVATAAAADVGSTPQALTLVALGVLVLAYSAGPRRIGFSYVGALVVSAGSSTLAAANDVTAVEVHSLPLAALLAGIGWVQWRREHHVPTSVSAGPALGVAFGPSLLAAVGEGDELRLALVTLAAVVVLVAGLLGRWRAPVTVAGAVLVVVAVSQGGPLLAYLPGVLTIGLAGAFLLAVGIAWERAVQAGRRLNTWYAALT